MRSLIVALSMYSRIPVPQIKWDDKSMRYAMGWMPIIGVIIGAVIYGAAFVLGGTNRLLFSAVMSVIPIIITGGIHLDGFIDCADALASYGDIKKRLDIMKDPHIGAFAIIWLAVYFVLSLGFWSEITMKTVPIIGCGFVISRALSALAVVNFKKAKNTGLAAAFSDATAKKRVNIVLLVWCVAALAAAVWFNPISATLMTIAAGAVFLFHIYNCKKNFGGITGDLAGFFLQICELAILLSAVIAEVMV